MLKSCIFLLVTFNFYIISILQKNTKKTTRSFLGVYLAFTYVSLISYNLEYYSSCFCFLDCDIFQLFCRMSFNLGLSLVSS